MNYRKRIKRVGADTVLIFDGHKTYKRRRVAPQFQVGDMVTLSKKFVRFLPKDSSLRKVVGKIIGFETAERMLFAVIKKENGEIIRSSTGNLKRIFWKRF